MSVKIFRVEGVVTKPSYAMPFSKDIRALKEEDAVEKVYADYGSQHRVKRVHMKITSISEVSLEETEDPVIRELSEE
jgi:large subunit ribosomal protein LX